MKLTIDTNIQHLINQEINKAMITFNASGGAALLMNVDNGEILSLISLQNFDINKRTNVRDKKYMNKIKRSL